MADGIFLLLGVIVLIGFMGNFLFKKTKIPEALFLIIIGMLLGPIFHVVDQSAAMGYASIMTGLMLIVIMLDNGLSFDIFQVAKALPMTIFFTLTVMAMTVLGLTALLSGVFGIPLIAAAIIALIICGDSTDVVTVLTARMHLPRNVKQLLVIESVVNDVQMIPFFILLGVVQTAQFNAAATATAVLIELPLAIAIGVSSAVIWVYLLGRFFGKHPLNYIATLGFLFVIYNIVQYVGTYGALTILTFSLILGNAIGLVKKFHMKSKFGKNFTKRMICDFKLVEFDISFLVRTIFFVFLGAVFSFQAIQFSHIGMWVSVFLVIMVARFIAVRLMVARHPQYKPHRGPITWIMARGFVAAALAFVAFGSGAFGREVIDITLMVIFMTTFVSIAYAAWYERKRN